MGGWRARLSVAKEGACHGCLWQRKGHRRRGAANAACSPSLCPRPCSRRQLWTLVPWDPAAVFLLARKHQRVYQELQAQAQARRLFTADQEAPPSQLHEGRTLLQVRRAARAGAGMAGLSSCAPCSACECLALSNPAPAPPPPPVPPQDLLCAAMHSRAAYGFPLAAGYMADVGCAVRGAAWPCPGPPLQRRHAPSIPPSLHPFPAPHPTPGCRRSYIKLQTLQPLTFDAVGGVSAEANNEAVAALAGLDLGGGDLIMAEWRNSPYRPCHYVAIDRANGVVVLAVRGSLQVGDLLSDLAAAPMEVEIGGADGWVHQVRRVGVGCACCLLRLLCLHLLHLLCLLCLRRPSTRSPLCSPAATAHPPLASAGHLQCCHIHPVQHPGRAAGGGAAVPRLAGAGHGAFTGWRRRGAAHPVAAREWHAAGAGAAALHHTGHRCRLGAGGGGVRAGRARGTLVLGRCAALHSSGCPRVDLPPP